MAPSRRPSIRTVRTARDDASRAGARARDRLRLHRLAQAPGLRPAATGSSGTRSPPPAFVGMWPRGEVTEGLPGSTTPSSWRRLLFGPSGLRAGWRLLLFFASFYLLAGIRDVFVRRVGLNGVERYVFIQATRFV